MNSWHGGHNQKSEWTVPMRRLSIILLLFVHSYVASFFKWAF